MRVIQRLPPSMWCIIPQILFVQVAVIYMCTRLMVNLTQVYVPLYLVDSLTLNKVHVIIVSIRACSGLASVPGRFLNARSKKGLVPIAWVIVVCTCASNYPEYE